MDSDPISRVGSYSGYSWRDLTFAYGTITLSGWTFQTILLAITLPLCCPTTPMPKNGHRFGLVRFRSPLLTESRFLSLPPGTKMFQFPGFAPFRVTAFLTVGFPHSEITGSKPGYGSPMLIAATHVLHRQSMPGHPS